MEVIINYHEVWGNFCICVNILIVPEDIYIYILFSHLMLIGYNCFVHFWQLGSPVIEIACSDLVNTLLN